MEYHKDRFEDFSVLIYKKDKLVSVVPANKKEDTVYSHSGLTYGGIVLKKDVKLSEVWDIYKTLLQYFEEKGFQKFVVKEIPNMYTTYPSDEFSYLTYILKAKLVRTDVASSIKQNQALKIQSNRKEGVKKAEKAQLTIKEESNFEGFWNEILIPNLQKRHGASPVHTVSEIQYLQSKFPKNIKQFNVYSGSTIVAGATIFETQKVAHVQYISANENRQELGALDYLFYYLILEKYKNKDYFDFGTSNENGGNNLNSGLLYWKECFGARPMAHRYYEIAPSQYSLMDQVFI
tara:strand:- start:82 stop:954 length:873 start_codon:yes stop_codon:yes gene_type:complete